jgi:hypothetical protein
VNGLGPKQRSPSIRDRRTEHAAAGTGWAGCEGHDGGIQFRRSLGVPDGGRVRRDWAEMKPVNLIRFGPA